MSFSLFRAVGATNLMARLTSSHSAVLPFIFASQVPQSIQPTAQYSTTYNRTPATMKNLMEFDKMQVQPKAFAGNLLPANLMWTTERLVTLQIGLLIPSIFMYHSQILESTLAALIILHAHWGMEHIIVDYCPIFLTKYANFLLYVASAVGLSGFIYFIYNDVGIAEALRKVWAI